MNISRTLDLFKMVFNYGLLNSLNCLLNQINLFSNFTESALEFLEFKSRFIKLLTYQSSTILLFVVEIRSIKFKIKVTSLTYPFF